MHAYRTQRSKHKHTQAQAPAGEAAFRLSELVCLPGSCVRKRLPSRLGVRQVVVTAKEDLAPEAAVSFRAQAALPQYSAQQGRVPVLQVSREDSQEHWVPLASAEVRLRLGGRT